jgi:flagellar motor switch protein FliM
MLSREHIRTLQIVQETLARGFNTTLASTLRAAVHVSVNDIDQRPYDEYIQEVPNPAFLTTVSLKPLAGAALLHIPLRSAFMTIELLLGGSGSVEQPNRSMTDLELGLMHGVVDAMLPEIRYSLEPVAEVEPAIVNHETNPQFAQLAAPTDMVIVISFELIIENVAEVMTLCIPFSSLQARLEAMSATARHGTQNADRIAREQARLAEHVGEATVTNSVVFRQAIASSRQIAELDVGDVLLFNHPVEMPLTLAVDGVATHDVTIGRVNRRYALEVVDNGRHRRPGRLQVVPAPIATGPTP